MRLRLLLVSALLPSLSGCGTLAYYTQAVSGQIELLRRATPIEKELQSKTLSPAIKAQLQAAQRMRAFASSALALPDNGSYKSYADLGRSYVVWNVFATPEFSMVPVNSCFLFVGCVGYRGYFHEADAETEAARLRAAGDDVFIGGVPAYSTLGWFDDPLLSTFIRYPPAWIARLIFHELAHQIVYVKDDTRFNESFAVAVEQFGVDRWLAQEGNDAERAAYRRARKMQQQFVALTAKYRQKLARFYAEDHSLDEKRRGKTRLFDELKAEYAGLKAEWGGFTGYDRWLGNQPNNATLASVALYTELEPAFRALLAREGDDLPRFYTSVKALAKEPKEARDAKLAVLMPKIVD